MKQNWAACTVLFSILLISIFNLGLTFSSIYIVDELGGSRYVTSYAIGFFALGNTLGAPLGRSCPRAWTHLHYLVFCLCGASLSTWACTWVSDYPLFLVMRFLQGMFIGPIFLLINRFQGQMTTKEDAPIVVTLSLAISTLGPVLGICLSNYISYYYHWEWLFYVDAVVLLLLALQAWRLFAPFETAHLKEPLDVVGYIFFFLGLFCLGFFFTAGQDLDWFRSPILATSFVVGTIALLFYILWSLYSPNPLFDLRILKQPVIPFGLLNMVVLTSSYFGMASLLSLWLNLYANYTPVWIAVIIGSTGLVSIIRLFFMSRYLPRQDTRVDITIALVCLMVSSFHTAGFNVDVDFGRILYSRILAGCGIAFALPPIFRLSMRTVPPEKSTDSFILFQVVRNLASGIGVTLFMVAWQRRTIFYRERLGERLTAFSSETAAFFAKAARFTLHGLQADAQLEAELERAATSLALNDCFFLMGWMLAALMALVLLSLFFKNADFFPEKKLAKVKG